MSPDTIAAIATPPGRGAVAIVRISGGRAMEIARRLAGFDPAPGRARFARLAADDALVVAFAAPRSYTGEDVVEIQCHGGSIAPRRVLDSALAAGARLARRGEFTERAFLNGKLSYEQCRSVLDMIDAKTVRAAEDAFAGLKNERARAARRIYGELVDCSAAVEHALDVDEGELPDGFLAGVKSRAAGIAAGIAAEIAKAKEGKILRNGAMFVLAGAPNAGKSSLMNALLKENRAIVSETPGTTRDFIEEWLDLDGWPVRLVDTAGIREATDAVESEGVRRTGELVAKADVVVALDCEIEAKSVIAVHAKCDLGRSAARGAINVSSVTGEGLDELKREMLARLDGCVADAGVDGQAAALAEISVALDGLPDDPVLVANRLRSAASRLGEELGATYSEDMLDRLFSRFCVGK